MSRNTIWILLLVHRLFLVELAWSPLLQVINDIYIVVCECCRQVHGEVTDPDVDIFDREKVFIDTVLRPLVQRFPRLKVVMEHVTTMDAVKFVKSCDEGIFVKLFLYPCLCYIKNIIGIRNWYKYIEQVKNSFYICFDI